MVMCKCLLGIACFFFLFLFLFLRLYCINCALFFWLDTVKPLGTTKTLGISHPACLEASVAALCGQESRHRCKKRPNYGNINTEPWPPRQKKLAPDTNTCTFDFSTTFRLLAPLTWRKILLFTPFAQFIYSRVHSQFPHTLSYITNHENHYPRRKRSPLLSCACRRCQRLVLRWFGFCRSLRLP